LLQADTFFVFTTVSNSLCGYYIFENKNVLNQKKCGCKKFSWRSDGWKL